MADYRGMYIHLFQATTKALDQIQQVEEIMQAAQRHTEELFLTAEEPALKAISHKKPDKAVD